MSEANASAVDSMPEHVIGTWYSVPDLRLRDHRFTVPLDYSIDPHASPKISVFAREVVAGTTSIKRLIISFRLAYDGCVSLSL